jgi:hypothetical protein
MFCNDMHLEVLIVSPGAILVPIKEERKEEFLLQYIWISVTQKRKKNEKENDLISQ